MTDSRLSKSLGIIVARRQSKRLPDKVLREINGHPMIGYVCAAAAHASCLDTVVISTEDQEIASTAKSYGVSAPFLRPVELAQDFAADFDIVHHALKTVEELSGHHFDEIVLMQATTPFLQPETIDACVMKLRAGSSGTVFSARVATERPQWMFVRTQDDHVTPLLSAALSADDQHTQNLAEAYLPTGGVYACQREALLSSRSIYASPLDIIEVPAEQSVDIDTELDLIYARMVADAFKFSVINQNE